MFSHYSTQEVIFGLRTGYCTVEEEFEGTESVGCVNEHVAVQLRSSASIVPSLLRLLSLASFISLPIGQFVLFALYWRSARCLCRAADWESCSRTLGSLINFIYRQGWSKIRFRRGKAASVKEVSVKEVVTIANHEA